jgi:hypothetical protein
LFVSADRNDHQGIAVLCCNWSLLQQNPHHITESWPLARLRASIRQNPPPIVWSVSEVARSMLVAPTGLRLSLDRIILAAMLQFARLCNVTQPTYMKRRRSLLQLGLCHELLRMLDPACRQQAPISLLNLIQLTDHNGLTHSGLYMPYLECLPFI